MMPFRNIYIGGVVCMDMTQGAVLPYSIDWLVERYYEDVVVKGHPFNLFCYDHVPCRTSAAVNHVVNSEKFQRILHALHPEIGDDTT